MYLKNKDLGVDDAKLKGLIRKLFLISILTSIYSKGFESQETNGFQKMNSKNSLEEFIKTLYNKLANYIDLHDQVIIK
ncbi:hypothetical protein CBF37_05735 [Vagococcus vulneris]|uniref:Uncharacterized protein n=2 Tax=Vagococcus vulneris TaxID=1977869 RepID=A0A429ZYX2_9ENTE|nr:hypothetical protein CBF37_05735 [Vagococcus vulneris]